MTGSKAQIERGQRQLARLETLVDCVFALVIVFLARDIPLPGDIGVTDLDQYFSAQTEALVASVIGLTVVLTYWFQSNVLYGNLVRTDSWHALAAIAQIFMVLLYLLSVGLGLDLGNDSALLALQSLTAMLIGFFAAAGWWYASYKNRLLSNELSPAEIGALKIRVLAEPATAGLTLVLAFIDPTLWELGWLAYPLIARLLSRVGIGAA